MSPGRPARGAFADTSPDPVSPEAAIEAAAAADPDWQEVDPDWVAKAEPVSPVRKRRLVLALDADVVDWFRARARHWRARMSAILRAYMERHRA